MNLVYFTKTSIGYSHIKSGVVCQDFSATYHDEERTIVTACDGHGGKTYIRSHLGSKFASEAIVKVFSRLHADTVSKLSADELSDNIRLNILCEWNALVEQHLASHRIADMELQRLSEDERFSLAINPVRAYGSTLNGAMALGDKLICASLGDGGVFLLKDGEAIYAFDEDDNAPVANVTYSLCQEDAYKHLQIGIFDLNWADGVLVCTDGLVNPYQNLANFNKSFVSPTCELAIRGKTIDVVDYVCQLGRQIGIGDDVSLGVIFKQDSSLLRKQRRN